MNDTQEWKPFNMCGVQRDMPNGHTVYVEGYESGSESGFKLGYRFGSYRFPDRAAAYEAAELLATALYLEQELA